jgi:hypothetical protein
VKTNDIVGQNIDVKYFSKEKEEEADIFGWTMEPFRIVGTTYQHD